VLVTGAVAEPSALVMAPTTDPAGLVTALAEAVLPEAVLPEAVLPETWDVSRAEAG
jgi:hypothetical protein